MIRRLLLALFLFTLLTFAQYPHWAVITWTASTSENGKTCCTYNVYRGTVSGGPYTLLGNTGVNGFVDTDALDPATTYYYVATAVDTVAGESAQSVEASGTTPGGATTANSSPAMGTSIH